MKKAIIFGIVAVLSAGMAIAQDDVVMVGQMEDSAASEAQTSVEAALVSSHVWRGQVYNNDMVFQPQITVEQAGVSVNVWGNYDLGSNKDGVSSDFSEIDFSLAYTLPINVNQMALDIGIIGYHFPDNGDGIAPNKSTTELFAKATVLSWQDNAVPVIPSVTLFGDIDEANGTYILIDVAVPYQVSDYVVVEGGLSAGYGNTSYNDHYWGAHLDGGWNDYNIYCNASYEITGNLTVALNLTGTVLEGGALRDAADAEYEAKGKLWGGVNVAYDF